MHREGARGGRVGALSFKRIKLLKRYRLCIKFLGIESVPTEMQCMSLYVEILRGRLFRLEFLKTGRVEQCFL